MRVERETAAGFLRWPEQTPEVAADATYCIAAQIVRDLQAEVARLRAELEYGSTHLLTGCKLLREKVTELRAELEEAKAKRLPDGCVAVDGHPMPYGRRLPHDEQVALDAEIAAALAAAEEVRDV